MIWTDEAIKTLKTMLAEGHYMAEIAKALSTTKSAVIGKANRMGFKSKHAPQPPPIVKKPLPPTVVLRATYDPQNQGVSRHLIGPRDCEFILGNGKCCGERTVPNRSRWPYCEYHLKKAKRKCINSTHQQK